MAADVKSSREFFRIEYPITDRPKAVLNGKRGTVVNLSEQGVKWETSEGDTPVVDGDRVFGKISFVDGETLDFNGVCIRSDGSKVAVRLSAPVPLSRIMNEQRALIKKFGDLKK